MDQFTPFPPPILIIRNKNLFVKNILEFCCSKLLETKHHWSNTHNIISPRISELVCTHQITQVFCFDFTAITCDFQIFRNRFQILHTKLIEHVNYAMGPILNIDYVSTINVCKIHRYLNTSITHNSIHFTQPQGTTVRDAVPLPCNCTCTPSWLCTVQLHTRT